MSGSKTSPTIDQRHPMNRADTLFLFIGADVESLARWPSLSFQIKLEPFDGYSSINTKRALLQMEISLSRVEKARG